MKSGKAILDHFKAYLDTIKKSPVKPLMKARTFLYQLDPAKGLIHEQLDQYLSSLPDATAKELLFFKRFLTDHPINDTVVARDFPYRMTETHPSILEFKRTSHTGGNHLGPLLRELEHDPHLDMIIFHGINRVDHTSLAQTKRKLIQTKAFLDFIRTSPLRPTFLTVERVDALLEQIKSYTEPATPKTLNNEQQSAYRQTKLEFIKGELTDQILLTLLLDYKMPVTRIVNLTYQEFLTLEFQPHHQRMKDDFIRKRGYARRTDTCFLSLTKSDIERLVKARLKRNPITAVNTLADLRAWWAQATSSC